MKFSNNFIKNSMLAGVIVSTLLITGCSEKSTIQQSSINKVYKHNPDRKIRNSKAMHRATLRSYSVFGKRYHPQVVNLGQEFTGIASWYGPNFHAKKTSNGEVYDMYGMTAAHKTLPMNTMLRVNNLENGRSVIVRINDRGPFVGTRIIDLSNTAAHKIDMVRKGTAKVKITVLGYNGRIEDSFSPINQMPVKNVQKVIQPILDIKPIEKVTNQNKTIVKENFNIQVGAFSRKEGALATKRKYESLLNNKYNIVVKEISVDSRLLHKVYISGFNSYNQAQLFKDLNTLDGSVIIKN